MKCIHSVEGVIVAEVLLATMAFSDPARADPVTHWNEITFATQAAAVPVGIRTPVAARGLAMVHLAIFDAVNSIDRRFAPYAVTALADPSASPEAATDAAAHAVLVSLYPSRQADLDSAYDAALASIAPGPARTKGILVGESAAGVILARRAFDGLTSTLLIPSPPALGSTSLIRRPCGSRGGTRPRLR